MPVGLPQWVWSRIAGIAESNVGLQHLGTEGGDDVKKPMPKPVKCACGGWPELIEPTDHHFCVRCEKTMPDYHHCWAGPSRYDERAAIEAWNRVMGEEPNG